jgi:response regulator RpfG family c-di-GMP phosphodiesterase
MNDNTMQAEASPPTLLCVDDEPNILSSLRRLFRPAGYRILIAGSGSEGLAQMAEEKVDLVISDMRMPEMDGAQFLAQVRELYPDTVRILLTGYADIESTVAAINQGEIYRYISKPWDEHNVLLTVREALERKELEREKQRLERLTQAQNEELKALNASLEEKVRARTEEIRQANQFLELANTRLKQGFMTSIRVFSNLIELRHGAMAGHSRRVADLARQTAKQLGLPSKEVQDVFLAGLLHDIGKIGLPDTLLAKPPAQMHAEEALLWKKHPAKGEQALMALEDLRGAASLILAHHERFDGMGYPAGLEGEEIPFGARILYAANEYDGLIQGTLTGHKVADADAQQYLRSNKGKRYDPVVVDALFEALLARSEPKRPEIGMSTEDLQPGMVLARDLVSQDGALLLATDYVLDAALIGQIRSYEQKEEIKMTLYIRTEDK